MKYWWMLKNVVTNEICDVIAENLLEAQKIAAEILGGNVSDYVERF